MLIEDAGTELGDNLDDLLDVLPGGPEQQPMRPRAVGIGPVETKPGEAPLRYFTEKGPDIDVRREELLDKFIEREDERATFQEGYENHSN